MNKNNQTYWIISDTHFGHDKLKKEKHRPEDFELKIMHNLFMQVKPDDIVIHLGDFSFYKDEYWTEQFVNSCWQSKLWLIRGNHDRRSNAWFMERGFDFVADQILFTMFGKRILFSHIPQPDLGHYDINVHGHFHNIDARKLECNDILTDKHKLVYLEHHYMAQNLRKLIGM